MEKINAGIVKKQIFYEIDIFFNFNDPLNINLFLNHIDNLIDFYENIKVNNFPFDDLKVLKDISTDEYFKTNAKIIIYSINNITILCEILSFFIGKDKAKKLIYS